MPKDITLHKPLMTGGSYEELFQYEYPMDDGETLEKYINRRIQEKQEDNNEVII